jgi:hypothetical protein
MSTVNGSFATERTLSMFCPSNIVSVAGVESVKNISLAEDIDFSLSVKKVANAIMRFCFSNPMVQVQTI